MAENSWTSARFAWGKLAEHCAVNGVCTFQSYDRHGRPVRRWERVTSGATLVDTNANILWNYRMPDATLPTYRVTEWRAPRCYGNFVRRHYNGLGQLYIVQTPYQDWEENYDGCGTANGLGSEIRVNYAYNALGKVRYTSVPQSVARSNYLVYDIDWAAVAKVTTTYDALGRVYDTIAFNGETTNTRYSGRITAVSALGRNGDVDRHLSWTMVNGLGYPLLLRVYEKNGTAWNARAQVMLAPNVVGNVTQIILPGGVGTTNLTYNLVGMKTSQDDDDLGLWSYGYDRQGKMIYLVDGRGQRQCFYYDIVGRPEVKYLITGSTCPTSPDTTPIPTSVRRRIVYQYDTGATSHRGQLVAAESNFYVNSAVSEFIYKNELTYNTKGFLSSDKMTISATANTWTTSFVYDNYNRPLAVLYPDGSGARTDYNSMGLPKSLCDTDAINKCTGTKLVDNVNYDVAGRIISMSFPAAGGFTRTNTYFGWPGSNGNSNGRLQKILLLENGVQRLKLEYS